MLRIRFGINEVTVTLSGEPDNADVVIARQYSPGVEVEYMHQSSFWCRLPNPLRAIRLASKFNEAIDLFRGDARQKDGP